MTDHALGRAIRAALDQQSQAMGRPADPRTVEAHLPQLVPTDQQDLLPALSFLLRSRALTSALAQTDGTSASRQASRLLTEVEAHYSPAICLRLTSVIEGLVGLPAQVPSHVEEQIPRQASAPDTPVINSPINGGGSSYGLVVALLSFLIGIVGSGVLLVLWLLHTNKLSVPQPSAMPPAVSMPAPPATRSVEPAPAVEAPTSTAALDAAVGSIQELYGALSAKDYARASRYFGSMAADQFEPTFFNQFERVTVADLGETSSTGSMINLEGVVTFVYRNGNLQTETRTFTVDTRAEPPLITGSEFGRVLYGN